MSMHSRPMYGACILLLLLSSHDRGQTEAATCDSRDVTDPTSRRDSAGWIRENLGANEMRQGHVSAGVVAWDKDILLAYGGTHIRTDDVTDVLGRTSNVSVLMDDGGTDSWTELEMIAYGGSPPALFRPGSFAWRNSLFVVCGHTSTPFAVTSRVWRADIQAFEEAPEGLWRPVNWTVPDDSVVNAAPTGMYGHTATMFATDDDDPDEVWVAVIGGMTAFQDGVEANYILHVADTGDNFICDDSYLPISSTYSCATRTHTRPADSLGEWWNLAELLEPGSSSPDQRSYHAAASLAADGLGNSSCVYVYSGRDYAGGLQFDDLWRLCPTGGYLGTYSDTTFRWTELTPTGNSPKGRQASYGHTLLSGLDDGTYRFLLYGGTGRYPNSYMSDEFAHEYDTVMNAWVDTTFANGSASSPVGRRDHTLEARGDYIYLMAGINNSEDALMDMWSIYFSSPVCPGGQFMFFCDSTSAPVCTNCSDGYAAVRASYECEICVSGTHAVTGSSECTPCPSGSYGNGDGGVDEETACNDCPAGTSTTSTGTASVDGCTPCVAGTYSEAGSIQCFPCSDGFYSEEGWSSCLPCDAGYYRLSTSSNGACDPCTAGTYAPLDQASECLSCPRGFYSDAASTSCSPCAAGTVGEEIAGGAIADACRSCAAGQYSEFDGSLSCDYCPAGTASAVEGATSSAVCETCESGTFAAAGASSCQACAGGSYGTLSGAESCEPCPIGTYLNSTGSTSADTCEYCPEGSTTPSSGSSSSAACQLCAPGTHTVALVDGGGCQDCRRGEYTSTFAEAQELNCTQCDGGFYANTTGSQECPECVEGAISYNAHVTCSVCDTNDTCPLGLNGEYCSNMGTCFLGVCLCSDGFSGVDCSDGTCDGCGGVFAFAFESTTIEASELSGNVTLTLVRFAGTDGDMDITVDIIGGNATEGEDFGGAWPIQVTFPSGESNASVSVTLIHDTDPDEGCEVLVLGITDVTGINGSAAVVGGIHDVGAEATLAIAEVDFTSAVLETTLPVGLLDGAGWLSPASAEVIVADYGATWLADVSLSVTGTTPSNRSLALPLDILFLAEADQSMSDDLERLADLLPGFAAEMQYNYSGTAFGVAAFASSSYFEVLAPLTTNAHLAMEALGDAYQSSTGLSAAPPGSQWMGLFNAAEDDTNDAGWRNNTFRIAVVITNSSFASTTGFDSADSTTWVPPDSVTLADLKDRLSEAAVHPIFLLTDEALETEYVALVREIGFGAAASVNETSSVANNYNDFYLPWALTSGLESLYSQAALVVCTDGGGFVSSVTPGEDASRRVELGSELNFQLNLSATVDSDVGSGEVELSFQGHKTFISVVRDTSTCEVSASERTTGAEVAASDEGRAGWVQGFYTDEELKWVFGDAFSFANETQGPFGVSARSLAATCPGSCDDEAYIDLTVGSDSEMPLVFKAYFYISNETQLSAASASLNVTYVDGTTEEGASTLDFYNISKDHWMQDIVAVYPTQVITDVRVTLKFSGTGDALFSGVGLFAHPDAVCRCGAGFYLNIDSASARLCTPQPDCTFFEGSCTYCPAGFKCPQGGVLTACLEGMYSMGGYTECYSCPVGWLCSNGLAVPCGYGTTMTSVTTVVQEDEGSTSSVSGIYGGACIECPAGNACPGGGVVEECSAGTFSAGGSATTVCRPCEPGTFASTNGTEACELCAPGYTSNFGSSECRECPSGAYSNGGEHPCSPCPAGTYSEGASAECISCPLGYYASTTSMSLCEQCPESTNTTAEGSTSVDDCV